MSCTRLFRTTVLMLLTSTLLSQPARADSTAELSVGGLVVARNADLSIESEELTITIDEVRIRYKFLNQGASPLTATLAFPLPDIDLSEADNYAIPSADPVNFLDFKTSVDGKPVTFNISQRAFLCDKDISAKIKAAGLPILPIGTRQDSVARMAKEAKDRLIDEGLLIPAGTDAKGQPLHAGSWTVKTSAVRQQTFPAGKPVIIEHRYRTSMGVSFDTILRKGLRENGAMTAEVNRYRTAYCIPDDLLKGIDRIAGDAEGNVAGLRERRIIHLLKGGANPPTPIKDLKIIVDKGKPDRLVSFCLDNVTKVSPTAFEIRMKDYTPDRDLKILLIGKLD
jgi:Domain of unknown function (DUF4424)